jgi:hypothetical protein
MTEREALKLALEALEQWNTPLYKRGTAITAIKEALAQPEHEPVIGTKTWFEDGKVVTQHLTAKDIYKDPEQPEQEPVAWGNFKEDGTLVGLSQHPEDQANWMGRKPLYTTPPQPQPEQEPVAWMNNERNTITWDKLYPDMTPLYTHPQPKREWVGLTAEEREQVQAESYGKVPHHVALIAAVEAKLKEKNS